MKMNTIDEIQLRLNSLSPLSCTLTDDSQRHAGHAGARQGGGHYQLHIVSSAFTDTVKLARHRMIYTALGDLMQTRVHALSISAQSPEEAGQA